MCLQPPDVTGRVNDRSGHTENLWLTSGRYGGKYRKTTVQHNLHDGRVNVNREFRGRVETTETSSLTLLATSTGSTFGMDIRTTIALHSDQLEGCQVDGFEVSGFVAVRVPNH